MFDVTCLAKTKNYALRCGVTRQVAGSMLHKAMLLETYLALDVNSAKD